MLGLFKKLFSSGQDVEGLKWRHKPSQIFGDYEIYTSKKPSDNRFGKKPLEKSVFQLQSEKEAKKVYEELLQINYHWKSIPSADDWEYVMKQFIRDLGFYTQRNRVNTLEYENAFALYKQLLNTNTRVRHRLHVCHNTKQWVVYEDYNGYVILGLDTKEQAIEAAKYLTRDYDYRNGYKSAEELYEAYKLVTGKEPSQFSETLNPIIHKEKLGKPVLS